MLVTAVAFLGMVSAAPLGALRAPRMNPDGLTNRLASSADDLDAAGTDPIYGGGRVNALRPVR